MRGFTLIELLAVIVILSIILLISVPIIGTLVEAVKKNSFKISSQHIAKAAEYTYANEVINGARELVFEFDDYEMSANFPDAELNFNGQGPQYGNIIIRKDGEMAYSFHNGVYCVEKDYSETSPSVSEKIIDECVSEISLPQLVILGQNPQYIEVNEVFVEDGATAVGVFGDPIANIAIEYKLEENVIATIDPTVVGTYRAIYTVVEDGKTNFVERSVIVRDTIKPVLNVPVSTNIVINEVNTFDFMAGVSVTDNSLETLTINVSGSIARIAGSYAITYSATDSSGNTEEVIRMINVTDIEAPVLTLNGAPVINLNVGNTYTELGATALDDADGNLTSSIITSGSVNTSTPGTYFITYTVTDSSSNESSLTRTINVIDNVAPTVTFTPNGNATYAKTRSTTVTVTDNVSVISRYYQWTTSTTAPLTGTFTQSFVNGAVINTPAGVSGSYYLWIKGVDSNSNEAITRSNVLNLDNTAPVITRLGSNPTNIFVGGAYTDSGATALDNIDGTITGNIGVSSNVTPGIPGAYTVTYNVTDASGNLATTVTRTVNVIDNIAPTVTFGTNGNATYGTTRNTTVTVSDAHGAVTSRHYQWTTSTTAPTSGSFSTTFTNGTTLGTPAGVSGGYYLWIKAVDSASNEIITRTNVFNLDNTVPVVTSVTSGISSLNTTSFTITRTGDATDAHSGLAATPYIYQTSLDNSNWTTRCTNNATSCAVTGMLDNTTYYYRICTNDTLSNQSCVASKTLITLKEEYSISEGVNKPVLVTGMTPVKWNGSAWINTIESDADWYNYTSVDKKWANAKTVDGSFWVWIPRYAYQIGTNYHISTEGTKNIKFLKAKTNVASDDSVVATTPTYSGSVQTNYIKHPAFTFGTDELFGFWVAKFEPSGTTANVNILPNVNPLVGNNFSASFNVAYNMRSNTAKYGWSGATIDTHMAKNIEWGAVAYLSKSSFGADTQRVWNNAYYNASYITGCSGVTTAAANETTCVQYHTTNGVKASTTQNIYGVYDMSGGTSEIVSAHISNGHDNLLDNLASIASADAKYRDFYSHDSFSDTSYNNYVLNSGKKGDAIYETSLGAENATSWFAGSSLFPRTGMPYFKRGYDGFSNSGVFGFYASTGDGLSNQTFRPIAIPLP